MFATSKRIKAPKEITAGISVKVVKQFKLPGVPIDNKLNYETYASMIKKFVIVLNVYFICVNLLNYNFLNLL